MKRKKPAWQKPLRWWAPWRTWAIGREWKRQSRIVAEVDRDLRKCCMTYRGTGHRATCDRSLMRGGTWADIADLPGRLTRPE